MKRFSKRRSTQSGASLMEFALVVPILFYLFLNTVNFAGFFFAWITIANAARAGADYRMLTPLFVSAPATPTAPQVGAVVLSELFALPNEGSAVVRVCSRTWAPDGSSTSTICETPVGSGGTFTDPPLEDLGVTPEAKFFPTLWVDVQYTYLPLIPMFQMPVLGVNLTLPPSTITRQAVIR